jgi:hypothetical protein
MVTTGDEVRELLETRWERLGYDNLLPVEKDYILAWWLQVEASNGSLHQYFYNSTGDGAMETLAALERIGANQAHGVLAKAVSAFGPAGYPSDRTERIKRLDSIQNHDNIFQRLADELFAQSADSEDVIFLALDRVGDAYNEQRIDASDYVDASRLRWPAAVVLMLVVFAAAIGLILMIAA